MAKQVTEQQVEQLIEGIIDKMQKANELFLTNIGEKIKKIRELKPSEAHKLIQILKYGGNYEDIINKISKVSQVSINKLDEMFKAYSIKDTRFAEDFYKYRNIPFTEYNKNSQLKAQTEAIANMAKKEMYDFTRNNVLGYTVRDNKGNEIFKGLRQVYNDLLDEAFINVGQGKETFDGAMRKVLKDIGQSGLKTIDYKSGRAVRLDSTIRMHLKNKLNELHNENQVLFGNEFDSDGVEISVHEYPAPDHEEVQGRQFSNEEYEKLQGGSEAKDYKGNTYTLDHDGNGSYRPISEMNCYHTIFSIILGVSEPEYTDEQLKQIQERNDEQFEFDGKLYNKYEGTQLQRGIEREIRKQKDIQILAKASDNKELMADAQERITILNYKYKDLCEQSGLKSKKQRMKVTGYKRTNVNRVGTSPMKPSSDLFEDVSDKYVINNKHDLLVKWEEKFKGQNIRAGRRTLNANPKLIDMQVTQVDELLNKYSFVRDMINNDTEDKALIMQVNEGEMMGNAYARFFGGHWIEFNEKYFIEESSLYNQVKEKIKSGWWQNAYEKNYYKYPVTHEFGHLLEFKIIDSIEQAYGNASVSIQTYKDFDALFKQKVLGGVKDFDIYLSGYAKSIDNFEWFAETFAQMELGEETPLTKELKKYIDKFLGGDYDDFR